MKKQAQKNCIGVFMDHAEAKLVDPNKSPSIIQVLQAVSGRVRTDGESGDGTLLGGFRATNNEHSKHNKKQQELNSFFKEIAGALLSYDELFIFGPTTAQKEFSNFLVKEKKFNAKTITIAEEDYMTDNQISDYVRRKFK